MAGYGPTLSSAALARDGSYRGLSHRPGRCDTTVKKWPGTNATNLAFAPIIRLSRRKSDSAEWAASPPRKLDTLPWSVDAWTSWVITLAFHRFSPPIPRALIARTSIEEPHAIAIARHPVLHPGSRSAHQRGDMRWRFQRFPVRYGARSRGRRHLALGGRYRICRSHT